MGPSTRATRKGQRSLDNNAGIQSPPLSSSQGASKTSGSTVARLASTRPRIPTHKQAEIEQQKVAELMKELERLRKDKARLTRKLATDSAVNGEEDDEDEYESEEEQEFRVAEQLHKSAFESRGVFPANSDKPKRKLRWVHESQSRQHTTELPSHASSSQVALSVPSPPPSPLVNPTHARYRTRSPIEPAIQPEAVSEPQAGQSQTPAQTVRSERSKSAAASSMCGRATSGPPPYKDDKVPKGKPKASDYESHASRMIIRACHFYSVLICTEDPFPDDDKQVLWADKAWLSICQEVQVFYRLTDDIEHIIVERHSHARGSLRDLVRPWIESTYGMLTDGTEHARITNIATYTRLLDLHSDEPHPVFHYQDTFTPSGFALHPIVHKVIQKSWFSDATGLGVRYSTYFSPIRNVTLALLFTAIEFCLDQWETGIFNLRLQFTEKLYKSKYIKHLRAIEDWREIDEEITLATMQDFHDRARRASGAAPLVAPVVVGLSASSRDRLRLELERQRRERQSTPQRDAVVE
ncbi:hypothetical protein DICSQDRAFT_172540 [Dichomitus squalens LYAD-421 SS1]|uniref:DUF6532 domain-containing protein n=1 Tax=Dichomitus squalens (strain LYAD-421) TaxID=732165 RepID=R7ST09_DICSQ|nr:uncharacterized protein DICSQDRAFT_172540 [Dichomitus squalens LYAD-421 SS1]EJF58880.1 hypothetical protein DICSQDRAFT_172540 [Dichomitus squalens LYAD-421 SS1]